MRHLLLLGLVGCGTPVDDDDSDSDSTSTLVLQAGFEASLDSTIACTDTWLQTWDTDGTVALEAYLAGIVAEAGSATATRTLDLATVSDVLSAVVAEPIADNYCTDALSERTVHETWPATAGTLVVTVDATSTTEDPTATMTLTDVQFTHSTGATIDVASFSVTDVRVLTAWGG